ncbi:MAG: LytTR family DNA-binding domain-containing protein [Chitinophagales bacterium]
MKVLIIDNEAPIRAGLRMQLETYVPEMEDLQEATGVATGLIAIETYQPDIVFLDVEMDDGTGLDLLKKLGNYNFQLIFITAHNKYAVDAFKFSAIDFLLKPIDTDDLMTSVGKAIQQLKNRDLKEQIQVLNESMNKISMEHKKIVLKDKDSIYFVKVNDIIRCHAEGPYTEFFISGGQRIIISKNLKEYEEMLEPFGFIRAHHSHLINIRKITRFDKTDGCNLIMENNDEVPVSQRKKEHLLEIIRQI